MHLLKVCIRKKVSKKKNHPIKDYHSATTQTVAKVVVENHVNDVPIQNLDAEDESMQDMFAEFYGELLVSLLCRITLTQIFLFLEEDDVRPLENTEDDVPLVEGEAIDEKTSRSPVFEMTNDPVSVVTRKSSFIGILFLLFF